MFHGRFPAFVSLAVAAVLTLPASGQSVISTRSGVINFFEGNVYLAGQALVASPGKFPSVPQGAELRTAQGRAEVLLTPGVFLRLGDRSAIRMVANELMDTRVELLAGSAIVDSMQPSAGTSVTLIYTKWSVRFPEQGIYRIDSDPPRLWTLQGTAEVSADTHEGAILVKHAMDVPFAPVLVPEQSTDQPHDMLTTWAEGRQQSISADNAIVANIQDPGSTYAPASGAYAFTYFPVVGLPSVGTSLYSTYGYTNPYQPGFNSVYLPGYTYMPVFLGAGRVGTPPVRVPFHPIPVPVRPVPPPVTVHPTAPRSISPHPISTVGVHAGGHR
jgi:hypothetical protein